MSCQIDGPGGDVDIHDPVNNLGLEISLMFVDDILLTSIVQLDKCQVTFCLLGDGFIDCFIVPDSLKEIRDSFVGINALVVRTVNLDLPDIGLDNIVGGADALEEHASEMVLDDNSVEHIVSPLPSGVGGIKDGNISAAGLQPVDRIIQRCLHALLPDGLGTGVVGIKEVVFGLLRLVDPPSVIPCIKHPGMNSDPVQVPSQFLGNVSLASCRQTHHDNDLANCPHTGPGQHRRWH